MSGSRDQNDFQSYQNPNKTFRVNKMNNIKPLKNPQTDMFSQVAAKDQRMPVFEKLNQKPVDLNKFTELKFQSS